MNIGIVLPEIGGFSSLSLEFIKWQRVMSDLGHQIYIMTGKSREIAHNVTVMAELHPENTYNLSFAEKVFNLDNSHDDDVKEFEALSFRIESIFSNWVESNKIDLLIIENYFSIPTNLPITYALFILFQKIDCKKIIKHHDAFYRNNVEHMAKNNFIKKILLACFPVDGNDIFHISSNRLIKSYLKEKCNIESIIIPYVINFADIDGNHSPKPKNLNSDFKLNFSDKILINFSSLLPTTKFDEIFKLLDTIQDESFKIISIVREHKDYQDYHSHLLSRIAELKLSTRIILLKEEDLLLNDSIDINYLFSFAKGIICLDKGVGFGQPLHMGILHKCPLLFCTQSQLDWLELSDLGCKLINISDSLSTDDIISINRHLNLELDWGEINYTLMKQYYSMGFLQYLLNGLLMRV